MRPGSQLGVGPDPFPRKGAIRADETVHSGQNHRFVKICFPVNMLQ